MSKSGYLKNDTITLLIGSIILLPLCLFDIDFGGIACGAG